MSATAKVEVAALVTPSRELIVPSAEVRRLALKPSQRVPVTVTTARRRRNMYGILSGRV